MISYSATPQKKTKIEVEKIVEVIWQGAKGGTSTTFVKELKIPRKLLCSNKGYCNVVQITYELKVEVEIDRWNGSIEVHFPITILSVPIAADETRTAIVPPVRNSDSPQVSRNGGYIAPPVTNSNAMQILPATLPAPRPTPMYDPPPSFEEVMKMDSLRE